MAKGRRGHCEGKEDYGSAAPARKYRFVASKSVAGASPTDLAQVDPLPTPSLDRESPMHRRGFDRIDKLGAKLVRCVIVAAVALTWPTAGASGSLEAIPSFLPAVYLLGEQKASSSSVYAMMTKNKAMCGGWVTPSDPRRRLQLKEPHFWDVLDSMYGSELAADPKWFEHQGHHGRGHPTAIGPVPGCRHDTQRGCARYGPDAPPVAAVSEDSLQRSYGKMYAHCEPKRKGAPRRLTVDATPKYLRFIGDTLFDRMAATYTRFGGTKPKFIVVIREPVSRALSWWNNIARHQMKVSGTTPARPKPNFSLPENCTLDGAPVFRVRNFTQFARCEEYIYDYRVGARLAEVARLFGRDRLLVLTTDMVQHHTAAAMEAIASFLQVPFSEKWRRALPHGNSGHISQSIDRVPCRTLRWLRDRFVEDQARLEALASEPGRPKAQPPYVRPTLPETQKCLLDGGKVGTVGRPTRR